MSQSSPCLGGRHSRCQVPDSCDCQCHDPDAPKRASSAPKTPKQRPDIELSWEEPPGVKRTTVPLEERLMPLIVELRRHPKRWARLVVYHSKTGAGGGRGKLRKVFPDIEFTARALDDNGNTAIYGRFMGE